jgi:XTP/dITP diphosphohydrolase
MDETCSKEVKRIVFATNNEGKMHEIRLILSDLGNPVYSMKEVGIDLDVVENGSTFEANALLKAKALAELLPNDIILADDSGLEIDYLDKAPGVDTANFAGRDTPYEIKNQILIDELEGVEESKRTARFRCVIVSIFPDGDIKYTDGMIEGIISHEIIGDKGFGYDPIFYLPEYGCTTGQMPLELKNKLSHRGKALEKMKEIMISKLKDKQIREVAE